MLGVVDEPNRPPTLGCGVFEEDPNTLEEAFGPTDPKLKPLLLDMFSSPCEGIAWDVAWMELY